MIKSVGQSDDQVRRRRRGHSQRCGLRGVDVTTATPPNSPAAGGAPKAPAAITSGGPRGYAAFRSRSVGGAPAEPYTGALPRPRPPAPLDPRREAHALPGAGSGPLDPTTLVAATPTATTVMGDSNSSPRTSRINDGHDDKGKGGEGLPIRTEPTREDSPDGTPSFPKEG